MTIELNEDEANLILRALGELPAKEVIQLILRLKNTWDEQAQNV